MTDAHKQIERYLADLPNWQRNNLVMFRRIVHEIEPTIQEDWKWHVPVFILKGRMVFAMSAFKAHTKYNFIANGALLDDNERLFNNGFDSQKSRAIDLQEEDLIDPEKLRQLIRKSIELAN